MLLHLAPLKSSGLHLRVSCTVVCWCWWCGTLGSGTSTEAAVHSGETDLSRPEHCRIQTLRVQSTQILKHKISGLCIRNLNLVCGICFIFVAYLDPWNKVSGALRDNFGRSGPTELVNSMPEPNALLPELRDNFTPRPGLPRPSTICPSKI